MKLSRKHKNPQNQPRNVQISSRPNSAVFSYHNSRSMDERNIGRREVSAPVKRSIRFDFRYVPTWLSVAAIGVSALYALSLSSGARVNVMQPGGSLTRDIGTYQNAASDILGDSIWNYSKLTINTKSVADQFQQQFPEIETVAVTLPLLGRKPIITIQTAEPAFLLSSGRNGSYYIDNSGRAMIKVSDITTGQVHTTLIKDESGIPVEPNKQILPKSTVDFMTAVMKQLDAKGVDVDYLELPRVPFEIRLHVKGKPYYVKLNTETDSRVQIGTYLAVKGRLESSKATPKEYIDVRVEERAFYK